MKISRLLPLAIVFVLTGCAFTETIGINDDGSGSFILDMDGSALMGMMPPDSVGSSTEKKVMDSTIVFSDLLIKMKDSIDKMTPEQRQRLKKMENFSMRIQMDEAKKKMMFSMITDFKNVAELRDAMSAVGDVQKLNPQGAGKQLPGGSAFGQNDSELKYTYDGKKFTRKATRQRKEKPADSLADMYQAFYDASTYTIKYRFPKKVKKVSVKSAVLSGDKRTVIIEYPMSVYVNEPEKLNFEVTLE
jgi:hypothetical protein